MTKEFIVVCPYCKCEIPLDEVLTHRLREELRAEARRDVAAREQRLSDMEKALAAREAQVEKEKVVLKAEFEKRLVLEVAKAEQGALEKARESLSLEMKDLSERLAEREREVKDLKARELLLRKDKLALEEARENLDLEIARRLDEERARIREDLSRKLAQEHQLKDQEREKIIRDLTAEIEELRHKAEHGSQQLRGEVLELALEDLLRRQFPQDAVDPVPKGMRGADIIQRVVGQGGMPCGTIIWESKRVKNWNDEWIAKLREDQREAKADVAALVSTVLPRDARGIIQLNGVWVADYDLAVPLAALLRSGLIRSAAVRAAMTGRGEKLDILYDYLSGPEFRQQVEGIVEAFLSLRKDLDAERRAMEKHWARREKQIEMVLKNTARMYGTLQGVIGREMPELPALDFDVTPSAEA